MVIGTDASVQDADSIWPRKMLMVPQGVRDPRACWACDRAGDGFRAAFGYWPVPPSVVHWVTADGRTIPLCRWCLDRWLDEADDLEHLEPSRLVWIAPAPPPAGWLT